MAGTNDLVMLSLQIVAAVGEAKSLYMEALTTAKEGGFAAAQEKVKAGDQRFAEGHDLHGDLIGREAGGDPVIMTLMLTHAEDQMMSAETIKLMVLEFIELYGRLAK